MLGRNVLVRIRLTPAKQCTRWELHEQFKQSAQALELLHERKMWNEQKPNCLSEASLRFLRMLFHILRECLKFLARKPFECSCSPMSTAFRCIHLHIPAYTCKTIRKNGRLQREARSLRTGSFLRCSLCLNKRRTCYRRFMLRDQSTTPSLKMEISRFPCFSANVRSPLATERT